MTNDVILHILEFLDEIFGAGKGYLIDILADFLFRHTNAVVYYLQRFLFLVQFDFNLQGRSICVGFGIEQLFGCVSGIGNQFPQKDVML